MLDAVLEHIEDGNSSRLEYPAPPPPLLLPPLRQLMDVEAHADGVLLLVRLPLLQTESALLPVKKEHEAMAVDEETVLKRAHDDYVREEIERQRRALEGIAARLHGREEGDVIILDNSDEEAPESSNPVCHANPG
ncbi:Cysteine-rich receptor-like protein kinase 10 [Hordeum vulgare]|nr:Cysteine-rich receptor-like protein kinase 10 [Hordeum vulgare]